MSAPVANWLRNYLTELGQWNEDGVSRRVGASTCGCGAPIIVGLDAPVAGLPTRAQPDPLDALGEFVAALAGRATYEVHGFSMRRLALDRRNSFSIAGSPAASTRAPYVVGEHRCGAPLPVSPVASPFTRFRTPLADTPPF